MGLQFSELYGANGLADLVGENASDSTTATQLKRAINDEYILHGSGRFVWTKRSHTYSASSSPAMATANTSTMSVPTASGSAFDRAYRLGYRDAGRWVEVDILEDDEWLERSATRTADAGYPEYARLIQTSSGVQLELDRPLSAQFISAVASMTFEYFIVPARMTSDTEEPILPDTLRVYLIRLAAYTWASKQNDVNLVASLTRKLGTALTTMYEEAQAAFRRHDLTRTGKSRTIRPKNHYAPPAWGGSSTDYGMRP